MILPIIVVYYLALFVGFNKQEAKIMTCIAEYESSFNTRALNQNADGSFDLGLMQINTLWHKEPKCYHGLKEGLYDPIQNMQCARMVYQIQGFNAWYGYKWNKEKCNNYKIGGLK
jgi:hypothetical protein